MPPLRDQKKDVGRDRLCRFPLKVKPHPRVGLVFTLHSGYGVRENLPRFSCAKGTSNPSVLYLAVSKQEKDALLRGYLPIRS